MKFTSHRHRSLIAVAIIMLITAAVALAATPKAGHYTGTTNAPKVHGYAAAVAFTVSANGKRVKDFQYADEGCFATMTQPPGNPFTLAGSRHALSGKAIAVSGGKFSIKNVKTTFSLSGTVTTTSVKGKFTSATNATGTITFSQKQTAPGLNHSCGPFTRMFTATAK